MVSSTPDIFQAQFETQPSPGGHNSLLAALQLGWFSPGKSELGCKREMQYHPRGHLPVTAWPRQDVRRTFSIRRACRIWCHLPHLAPLLLCCSTLASLQRGPIPGCSPISFTHCSRTRSHCAAFPAPAAALEWMALLTLCSKLSAVEGMLSHWQSSWKCFCRAAGLHACLMDP